MGHETYSLKFTREVEDLLNTLDADIHATKAQSRRSAPRMTYRQTGLEIQITHPGGNTVTGLVPTRDLGSGGLSFLFWGFLHNGTQVAANLVRRDGTRDLVHGTVCYCRYLGSGRHLVGLKFNQRILTQLYVREAGDARNAAVALSKHRVLLIDDQELDRMLFVHQMLGTPLEAHAVATVDEAISMAERTPIGLILCDMNLRQMTGEQAIARLRKAGFQGTIMVCSVEDDAARHEAARAAGATAVLHKPCSPEALRAVILQHLADEKKNTEPIYSNLQHEPGAEAMVFTYVESVKALSREIEEALGEQNTQLLRTHIQTLKGSGEGYGFPLLSVVASEAVNAIDAAKHSVRVQQATLDLITLCHRLTTGKGKK